MVPIGVTFLKGKLWFGAMAIAFIPVAWVAAVRLARPGSPWAHFRYRNSPKKSARAQARADKWVRRQKPIRDWIASHLFGLTEDTSAPK